MGFCKRPSFYCWYLALMIQCSSSSFAVHDASSGNPLLKMNPIKIANVHEKRDDGKISLSGRNGMLRAENHKDVMTVKPKNDFDVTGMEKSHDRFRGKALQLAWHKGQRNKISEGRRLFHTKPLVLQSKSTHGAAKNDLEKSVPENIEHMRDKIKRGEWDIRNGSKTSTSSASLKDVRFNDLPCGPRKACSCYVGIDYYYVNCSRRQLKEFPTSLPSEASIIDLSHNTISSLSLYSISLYPKLIRVSFANNIITNIIAFHGPKEVLQMEYVDLSHNNLTDIANLKFLSSLVNLSLSHNSIIDIDRKSFLGMEKLEVLDMSHNDVRRIDEAAFDSLVNLKAIYLNSNAHLGYSDRILSARLFEKLTKLEILWIQNNTNREDNNTYPNKALGKLTNLRELVIDGLGNGTALSQELNNLPYLNCLMIGFLGNCYIETIGPNFFDHVGNLTSLVFSGCNFTSDISPDAFKNIRKLEKYSILFPGNGYNWSKAFQDLEGLLHTNVTSLRLEGFKKTFQPCRTLTVNNTKHIRRLKLKTLNMNFDYLEAFEFSSIFDIPKTIETLNLRCNQFSTINKHWSSLQNLTALYEVDVRDQNVNCSAIADNKQQKKGIPLLNPFASLENEPMCARKAKEICKKGLPWKTHNKSNCDPGDLSMLCFPPNLQFVKASGNTEFGKAIFTRKLSPNKLCYLDFSRGFFTTWGKGVIPKGVKVADLGDNFCDTLSHETFDKDNSLQYLCIQNNYFGHVFASDVNGTIFSQLKHLKYLNIARNHIFLLRPDFLRGLNNLEILNLQDNKLENVELNFSTMPKLRSIDLSRNSIKWISRLSRRQLDALAENHSVSLDLSYNPLPCTCRGIEVLQWLRDSKVRIKGWGHLVCKDEKEYVWPIGDVDKMLHVLKSRCFRNKYLIITGSFCCALFVIILVSGLLYKHRWKLIYSRNIWLFNLYGFRPAVRTLSQHAYDAYVVYCNEDRDFALDKMIEELEGKRGHRLCVEDRDFIPGSFNFNNITCAIKNSKVTILLLSPEFVRNKELEYATQMALMEQYNSQTKRDMILLLCYRDVPSKEMTKDLLLMMKKGRFLDYPGDEDDSIKQKFWDRVSNEIGRSKSTSNNRLLDNEMS